MAVSFSFDAGSTSAWAQRVKSELPAKGLEGMRAAVHEGARLIRSEAKASAPRASGDLAGSIQIVEKVSRFGARAEIGPTVAYGRRAELGYHGTDSRGRSYASPGASGHPFMGPGAKRALAELESIFRERTGSALAA